MDLASLLWVDIHQSTAPWGLSVWSGPRSCWCSVPWRPGCAGRGTCPCRRCGGTLRRTFPTPPLLTAPRSVSCCGWGHCLHTERIKKRDTCTNRTKIQIKWFSIIKITKCRHLFDYFLHWKQNKRTKFFLEDFFLYEAFTGTFLIGALQRVECKAKSNKKILVLTQYLKNLNSYYKIYTPFYHTVQ